MSTGFIGLDHRLSGKGPPLLFETMIFGGKLAGEQWRYSSWDDAEAGHKAAVRKARKAAGKVAHIMKGTMLVYSPGKMEPTTTEDFDPRASELVLQALQRVVGGYLELVPGFDTIEHNGKVHPCRALCNEEGKLARPKPLPVNQKATELWWQALERKGMKPFRPFRALPNHLADALSAASSGSLGEPDRLVGNIIVLFGDREFMELL